MAGTLARCALLLTVGITLSVATPLSVDRSSIATAHTFDGIGGLSGGGATSRLLVDYKEPERSQILDYLFKPFYGASLQILKVEIGGDSQSTDGTESSHMHDSSHIDLETGYEWWLMTEAKKRNPEIKLYGLPWAYPGWVGNDPETGVPSGSPFKYPNQTSRYIMEWVKGAKSRYDLEIDYIGIWNERDSDATYAESLRSTLNDAGFANTKIVAKDGGADICDSMAKDPKYGKSVDVVGLHYPSDFSNYSVCHALEKPIWASEESSSYDDLNGAACWGRIINAHYALNQMTSSIMWNLVGAYYHGTNWYASSILTSVQPWSGHYEVNPVVWATAHVTQFSKVGWKYLQNDHGSGSLPQGGYYTTLVDPSSEDFSINVVKVSHEHASCTRPALPDFEVYEETVTFVLDSSMQAPDTLAVWYSNYNTDLVAEPTLFKRLADVTVQNNQFQLTVPIGAHFTITTTRNATHPVPPTIPASTPSFPLPHEDDFQAKPVSQEAAYLADQIGAFEVHYETGTSGNKVMKQMVPQLPIGWSDHGSNGPMSLIGMREWQDIELSVSFKLPAGAASTAAGCVATRVDQMWQDGIALCVAASGHWNLTVGGPKLADGSAAQLIKSGQASAVGLGAWARLVLSTTGGQASGSVNGVSLFDKEPVRDIDTGFGAIGANDWFGIEYDNLTIYESGSQWHPSAPCAAAKAGDVLTAQDCSRNGIAVDNSNWQLDSNWNLVHVASGLCATAQSADAGGAVTLQQCALGNEMQRFVNDYTRIRNGMTEMSLHNHTTVLTGSKAGGVQIGKKGGPDWSQWVFFPNTGQLRNQYTANTGLGYPKCLSTCSK